jgi:predicted nucleic acid-binding protein
VGAAYLLDTNAISKTLRGLFPEGGLAFVQQRLTNQPKLSVITRIELLGWKPDDPAFAADLALIVQQSTEYALTEAVILKTIELRKQVKIKLPDAIIAATALVHKLTLVSDNDTDFLRVPKLRYVNPARLP